MNDKVQDFSDIPGVEVGGKVPARDAVSVAAEIDAAAVEVGAVADVATDDQAGSAVSVVAEGPARPEKTPEQARAGYLRLLLMLMRFFFNVITPNWKVTEDEVQTLANAWADALMELWPQGFDFGAVAEACVYTGDFLSSRLGVPRKTADQEKSDVPWYKKWGKSAG